MMKLAAGTVKSASSRSARSANSRTSSFATSLGLSERTQQKFVDAIRLAVIAIPPITAVVVLSVLMIIQVDQTLRTSGSMNDFLKQSQQLNSLINSLQRERGMTCVLVTRLAIDSNTLDRPAVMQQLAQYRNSTDTVIMQMSSSWNHLIAEGDIADLKTSTTFSLSLANHRASVSDDNSTCKESLDFYTPVINQLIYNAGRVFYDSDTGQFWGTFDALRMVLAAEEMYGLKRATGGSFFAQGYLNLDSYKFFTEIGGAADRYMTMAEMSDTDVKELILQHTHDMAQIIDNINKMSDAVYNNQSLGNNKENSMNWFQNMTLFSDNLISSIRSMLTTKLSQQLVNKLGDARVSLIIASTVVAASLIVCVPLTVYYGVQNAKMQKKIKQKMHELAVEKSKSENILFQMMPKTIVKELQAGRQVLPRMYTECTIYFSDLVGFTDICSSSSPFQVVDLLNFLYTAMDTILDQYSCYKVETIGDAYLVVSGVPNSNGHDHSNQIATMALHMLKEISSMSVPHRKDQKLNIRIGINTGSCAAGIVGVKMPRYCLFGDAVNTASRMESTGMGMRIQLSESTFVHLNDYHSSLGYETPLRGQFDVKGKGSMNTYWLQGKKRFPYRVDLSAPDRYQDNTIKVGCQNSY